jgi:hypothetical protein
VSAIQKTGEVAEEGDRYRKTGRTGGDLAPTFPVTYRVLASCYAHMGRLGDARNIVGRLRAITLP